MVIFHIGGVGWARSPDEMLSTKRLQPHRDLSLTVSRVGGTLLFAGFGAMAIGWAGDGGPHSAGRYTVIAGLILACLSFFFALGFWVQHAHARRALAEMEAGAVLGDWRTDGVHVQVGPKLALVGGRLRRYGLWLQAVTEAYVDTNGELVVRATADSGYGPGHFEVRLPGSPKRDETERCARALSEHHALPAADR